MWAGRQKKQRDVAGRGQKQGILSRQRPCFCLLCYLIYRHRTQRDTTPPSPNFTKLYPYFTVPYNTALDLHATRRNQTLPSPNATKRHHTSPSPNTTGRYTTFTEHDCTLPSPNATKLYLTATKPYFTLPSPDGTQLDNTFALPSSYITSKLP